MHLAGFIIRIYHDARSSERQTRFLGRPCCNLATVLSVILLLYILPFARHLCCVVGSCRIPFVGPVIVTYFPWLLTVRSLKCGREINLPNVLKAWP